MRGSIHCPPHNRKVYTIRNYGGMKAILKEIDFNADSSHKVESPRRIISKKSHASYALWCEGEEALSVLDAFVATRMLHAPWDNHAVVKIAPDVDIGDISSEVCESETHPSGLELLCYHILLCAMAPPCDENQHIPNFLYLSFCSVTLRECSPSRFEEGSWCTSSQVVSRSKLVGFEKN